ncbi:ABC-type multidrug transport system, permease component [Leptolyngbya sp. PCC 7375]|nr:ABC-type multidrug transport system, permease component [Leptolyngbya sp. PCC 7375]
MAYLMAQITRYWQEILAVAQRILLELVRRRRSLIFWAIFPTLLLLLNGVITTERAQLDLADALEVVAPPTLVGAALFFSCLGGSVATVVAEREQNTLKRLFLSPLRGVSYFLGIVLAHSAIGVGQALLVFAIALTLGATFPGSWPLAMLIILLSILAYVGVGFILGTQFARRTEDVNALVAAFGVPLLIMGGAFMPTSIFPDSLLQLARFNPIFHMTEALTLVMAAEPANEHIAFLSIFALAMVVAGWLSYRRMLNLERQL